MDHQSAPTPSTGRFSGRKSQKGRKLMRWDPSIDQHVLLAVEYLVCRYNIPLDWNDVGCQINDTLSGEAIKQHLLKLRTARVKAGQPVPETLRSAVVQRNRNSALLATPVKTPLPSRKRRATDDDDDDTDDNNNGEGEERDEDDDDDNDDNDNEDDDIPADNKAGGLLYIKETRRPAQVGALFGTKKIGEEKKERNEKKKEQVSEHNNGSNKILTQKKRKIVKLSSKRAHLQNFPGPIEKKDEGKGAGAGVQAFGEAEREMEAEYGGHSQLMLVDEQCNDAASLPLGPVFDDATPDASNPDYSALSRDLDAAYSWDTGASGASGMIADTDPGYIVDSSYDGLEYPTLPEMGAAPPRIMPADPENVFLPSFPDDMCGAGMLVVPIASAASAPPPFPPPSALPAPMLPPVMYGWTEMDIVNCHKHGEDLGLFFELED